MILEPVIRNILRYDFIKSKNNQPFQLKSININKICEHSDKERIIENENTLLFLDDKFSCIYRFFVKSKRDESALS